MPASQHDQGYGIFEKTVQYKVDIEIEELAFLILYKYKRTKMALYRSPE